MEVSRDCTRVEGFAGARRYTPAEVVTCGKWWTLITWVGETHGAGYVQVRAEISIIYYLYSCLFISLSASICTSNSTPPTTPQVIVNTHQNSPLAALSIYCCSLSIYCFFIHSQTPSIPHCAYYLHDRRMGVHPSCRRITPPPPPLASLQ
jgi:hypothetical protein